MTQLIVETKLILHVVITLIETSSQVLKCTQNKLQLLTIMEYAT